MAQLLFTHTKKPLSRLICWGLREPVSHVALKTGDFVFHSTGHGISVWTEARFRREYAVALEVTNPNQVISGTAISAFDGKQYDTRGLMFLAVRGAAHRFFRWPMPKTNQWARNGYYMCTEFVTALLEGQERSSVTPYQLYLDYAARPGWTAANPSEGV